MLRVHTSPAREADSRLKPLARRRNEGNVAWLDRALKSRPPESGVIVLLGGASLTHFRLRVAQSQARRDLLPSFWSHAAIVQPTAKTLLYETSLEPAAGRFEIPLWHGIQTGRILAYDDPAAFPNIAAIQWRLKPGSLGQDAAGRDETFASALDRVIERLRSDRGTIDLPSALWAWLGFAWGVGDQTNPLLRGVGIPSALLVETVFSMMGIELSPGLASQSTCPEAIWQAAKWWGDFYDSEATLTEGRPTGFVHIGQAAAAVTSEPGGEAPKPASRRRSG